MTETPALSPNTLKQYSSILNRLKEEDLFPLLQKHPRLVTLWISTSASKTGSVDTQNSYLNAILWHLRKEYPSADLSFYTTESKRLQLLRKDKSKQQMLPEGKLDNLLSWKEITELKSKAKETLSEEDYLLYLLYTEMPPLRADFCNLRILPRDKAGLTGNYIVALKKKFSLVLQEYKTAKTFGKQVFDLPKSVVEHLKQTWKDAKPPSSILSVTENALSKRVSSIFERLSGKKVSINLLRHAFVKQFLATPRTILEKEQMALRMLHSKTLQEQYDVLPQPEKKEEAVAEEEAQETLSDEEQSLDFLA